MKKEIWVAIPGFKGYMVSNFGRVKSLNYNKTGKEGMLATLKTNCGYLRVNLQKDNKSRHVSVHRIVWEAFNGPIPPGMQINHIDEDKTNNNLDNLELVTPTENLNYGTRNKRAGKSNSKTILQYSLSGDFIKEWESATSIMDECGYWSTAICAVCRGEKKTAYGYRWSFK